MSIDGASEGVVVQCHLYLLLSIFLLEDPRLVIWFDIDNTLYSASTKISHAMGERIHGLFALWIKVCSLT